jgi:hypothetical protein
METLPRRRVAVSILAIVVCLGLAGCAPSSPSAPSSELPTGRQTAEATRQAVQSAEDAGTTGLIYASNTEGESSPSPDAGTTSAGSQTTSRPDASSPPDTSSPSTRRLTVTIENGEWRASDGSSFRELGAFRKWWTGLEVDASGRVICIFRLVDDIEASRLGLALEVARDGGADAVEVRFEGGRIETPDARPKDRPNFAF